MHATKYIQPNVCNKSGNAEPKDDAPETSKKSLLEILAVAHERGMVLVATSQCAMGGVVLAKYAAGSGMLQ